MHIVSYQCLVLVCVQSSVERLHHTDRLETDRHLTPPHCHLSITDHNNMTHWQTGDWQSPDTATPPPVNHRPQQHDTTTDRTVLSMTLNDPYCQRRNCSPLMYFSAMYRSRWYQRAFHSYSQWQNTISEYSGRKMVIFSLYMRKYLANDN